MLCGWEFDWVGSRKARMQARETHPKNFPLRIVCGGNGPHKSPQGSPDYLPGRVLSGGGNLRVAAVLYNF